MKTPDWMQIGLADKEGVVKQLKDMIVGDVLSIRFSLHHHRYHEYTIKTINYNEQVEIEKIK